MKEILILVLATCGTISLFAQKPIVGKTENEIKIERELSVLNDSLVRLNGRLIQSAKAIKRHSDQRLKTKTDSLTKQIVNLQEALDENRLKKHLEAAERMLQFQNLWLQIFGVIYAVIAVAAGLAYFFSFRPLFNRAEQSVERTNLATQRLDARIDNFMQLADHSIERTDNATQRLDSRIDNFIQSVDNKIAERFTEFEKSVELKGIDELFKDIESDLATQRKLATERLSLLNPSVIVADKIDRLFQILNKDLVKEEKTLIVGKLIQVNSPLVKKYFQTWTNVKADDRELKTRLYFYYCANKWEDFMTPVQSFVLNHVSHHEELKHLLSLLPSHPSEFTYILNYKPLINSIDPYSRQEVIKFLNDNINSWGLIEADKVKASLLVTLDNEAKPK